MIHKLPVIVYPFIKRNHSTVVFFLNSLYNVGFEKEIYNMHNKEILLFPNKLKVIISSCLRRLFPRRKYFLVAGSTFPMQSVYISAGIFESCWHVLYDITPAVYRKKTTTLRMQDVRLGGNVELKNRRT